MGGLGQVGQLLYNTAVLSSFCTKQFVLDVGWFVPSSMLEVLISWTLLRHQLAPTYLIMAENLPIN